MRQSIRFKLLFCLLVVFLPWLVVSRVRTAQHTFFEEDRAFNSGWIVVLDTEGGTQEADMEAFVLMVTAAQIPGDYAAETLKAQTVIARTAVVNAFGSRGWLRASQMGIPFKTIWEMKEMWGASFWANYEALREAVLATKGEVLTYQDRPVVVPYFAVSSGNTRSSSEAWGKDCEWLVSVDSSRDEQADNYEQTFTFSNRLVIRRMKEYIPGFGVAVSGLEESCQVTDTDSAGYILKMQLGNKIITGDTFAAALGLPSSCFAISFDGQQMTVSTRGVGEGVGFDQYGAQCMALEGETYDALLSYYFTGTALTGVY